MLPETIGAAKLVPSTSPKLLPSSGAYIAAPGAAMSVAESLPSDGPSRCAVEVRWSVASVAVTLIVSGMIDVNPTP